MSQVPTQPTLTENLATPVIGPSIEQFDPEIVGLATCLREGTLKIKSVDDAIRLLVGVIKASVAVKVFKSSETVPTNAEELRAKCKKTRSSVGENVFHPIIVDIALRIIDGKTKFSLLDEKINRMVHLLNGMADPTIEKLREKLAEKEDAFKRECERRGRLPSTITPQ
jgi:hypothetical protein